MKTSLRAIATILFLTLSACQIFRGRLSPGTGEYYRNLWNESQELLRARDFQRAEVKLDELYKVAASTDPKLSTLALYELALLNESHGQWELALVRLKECERKKEYLPLEKAELELPAHLSGLYSTLGEMGVANEYFRKSESAFQTYAAQIRIDKQPSWWAETFYKMGYFPINHLTEDNWMPFAKRFDSTSLYLVRSMEVGDAIWSQRSYNLASGFLKSSLDLMNVLEPGDTENWIIKTTAIKDKMVQLDGIIETLKLWKPIKPEKSHLIWSFYETVDLTEKELQNRWASLRVNAPPSLESLRRNSFRREGLKLVPVPAGVDKRNLDPNL